MKPGLNKAFKRLEPYDAKVSRTVLRGRRFGQPNFCYPTVLFLLISVCCNNSVHGNAHTDSCRTSSIMELARENRCYQNPSPQDSFVELFQQESLQKVEALQKDPSFQNILSELQDNASKSAITSSNPTAENRAELYIFISFSLGEKAILNLAHEARRYGATLVLRGFKDGSYLQTAKVLQKIIIKTGQGVLIDPELYPLFHITAIPTFVLSRPFQLYAQTRTQTPIHDRLQGHVSVRYALEQFVKEGDLVEEAQVLLQQSVLKRGVLP